MGSNGEAALNNNGRRVIDVCIFNNLNIMNMFLMYKGIQKFTREVRGHKSITDCFMTNMKISKVMQGMRV
jgi:hypothetical protein